MALLRRIASKVEIVNKVHLLRAIEFMVPIKTRHPIESSALDVSASNGRLPVIAQLAHLSLLAGSATRERAPGLHRGQKVCPTGAMF